MKRHILADFYLELLREPPTSLFRLQHQHLYAVVRDTIAVEIGENNETVQRIFERMAVEDGR